MCDEGRLTYKPLNKDRVLVAREGRGPAARPAVARSDGRGSNVWGDAPAGTSEITSARPAVSSRRIAASGGPVVTNSGRPAARAAGTSVARPATRIAAGTARRPIAPRGALSL